MMKINAIMTFTTYNIKALFLSVLIFLFFQEAGAQAQKNRPNIIIIYTDDLGYGDLSAYGATKIQTPNIDRIANEGIRFTNAHTTSSTCTPSRFSLLTGKYAWRKQGTGIAPGDAALLIPTDIITLPGMLKQAGYHTAAVGKWHLGLGPKEGPDWNGEIKPGPLEIGFDYCFLLPATGDRVPCVYLQNHRIVDLDSSDPIKVDYKHKVGNEPTGSENPELLKMKYSHEHDNTIINGVSRIGWMSGGHRARWVDENMADMFVNKAVKYLKSQKDSSFFLYFAPHQIHVPRLPNSNFVGKSGMGPRGDAILELDWTVGQILKTLDELNLTDNTLVIFSSDNGPVLDDGYQDKAEELVNGHTPSGMFRGGKYSAFDAGTRVPLLVRWPKKVKKGHISSALFSHIDFYASLAHLAKQKIVAPNAPDSYDNLKTLLGTSEKDRKFVVEQSLNNTLSIIDGKWKYIESSNGPKTNVKKRIELGNNPAPQLYNLDNDPGENQNLASTYPEITLKLAQKLEDVRRQ